MDQAEASGKTVEDALNRALAQLGASREEVEFVVLDEGRKGGLFGRGGKEAVVRVERVAGAIASSSAPPPDTRIPRGSNRGGGGQRNRPPQQGGTGGSGSRDRGRDPNRQGGSSSRGQTRTGFDSAVPKLTDADFTRTPRYEGAPEEPAATPADGEARTGRRRRGGRGRGGAGAATNETGGAGNDAGAAADRPPRQDRPPRGDRERRRRDDEPRIEPDINAEEVDFAAQTVDDILRILDIGAELNIREPLTAGDGLGSALAVIDVMGDDLGLLIGRRGDTLLALQYLVNLILARRYPGKGGITLDVEHYKHRREEQVVSLAKRMAERVRETGSPITLEPMSAGERRIIHLLFAEDDEVETNSIGEGDNRKVVISSRR